jgi:hypothetical protein
MQYVKAEAEEKEEEEEEEAVGIDRKGQQSHSFDCLNERSLSEAQLSSRSSPFPSMSTETPTMFSISYTACSRDTRSPIVLKNKYFAKSVTA